MTLYTSTIEKLKAHTSLLCCYNPDHPFKFFSPGSGNKHILDSIPLYDMYFTFSTNISEQLKKDWNAESYAIPFGYDDSDVTSYPSAHSVFQDKWLFIGTWDKERMNWLSSVQEPDLNIYGDSNWSTRSTKSKQVAAAYRGGPIYDGQYIDAIQNASGVINLLRRQNIEEGSHNMRTFEVPGYGGLLIANRTTEQGGFFEEDKEAIFFENVEELNDKLKFLGRNQEIVGRIKQAARIRSESSGYSYNCRSRQLVDLLSKHL